MPLLFRGHGYNSIGRLADAIRPLDITPAAKKVIYQPEAPARDPVRFPRWRVGLICSSMRNFLAGVIEKPFEEGEARIHRDQGMRCIEHPQVL